ncbi:DUF1839 family protein [Wenjunlia tyrosinilytica]|nr:DUF1839 family protein [Wenjunlia tyrosinilytica]
MGISDPARDASALGWRYCDEPFSPHPLHLDASNDWLDANCYTDLWIELLHGLGLDPTPMLSFTLGIDFEGDQWTFFKPPAQDLWSLYGIDLIELMVYEPLDRHAATQLAMGRIPIMEVDAYFLPDVPRTYHCEHAKTTIAVVAVDPSTGVARYLHNAGCFQLQRDDYAGAFRVGAHAVDSTQLAPYVEAAKVTGAPARRRARADLVAIAMDNAARHVARRGGGDAMETFLDRFFSDVTRMTEEDPGGATAMRSQLCGSSEPPRPWRPASPAGWPTPELWTDSTRQRTRWTPCPSPPNG